MLESYSMQNAAKIISDVYAKTGNIRITGFLGENIGNVGFDINGNIEFATEKVFGDTNINSYCTMFQDSILVKQVVTRDRLDDTRLYSYDFNNNIFTCLSLSNELSLNKFYEVMKRFEMNLCSGDITDNFKKMGLTFDDVIQVFIK